MAELSSTFADFICGVSYDKFRANATLLIPEDDAKRLGEAIMNLEKISLSRLVHLI